VRKLLPLLGLLSLLTPLGCKPKHATFSSSVEIRKLVVVRKDDQGQPQTSDVEIEWTDCPGDQHELLRGNTAFTKCLMTQPVHQKLPVQVTWSSDEAGHDWEIVAIGPCARVPDKDDETSFDSVQECHDVVEHDAVVGFQCDRVPHHELVAKCPWFQRR
jgi:hypothetical protein